MYIGKESTYQISYNWSMENPSFFKDPYNPTSAELKKWAYGDYYQPDQDFQLYVMNDPMLVLEFASDLHCPSRQFFLESLYVWVGDKVKTNNSNDSTVPELLELFN